jgi:hypothetical protein
MAIDRSFVQNAQVSNTDKNVWIRFLDLYDTYTATVDAAELILLDGALVGAVIASKAAVYDAAGKLFRSSATPAAAGTLISNATVLTAELNAVTGANGSAGVKLPVAAVDEIVIVINTNASNNLLVYPVASSQINALGASNAFTVTPGQIAIFVGRSATLWYTAAATDTIVGLTASAAELNFNDGPTVGVATASKTAVLGTGKNLDTLSIDPAGMKSDGVVISPLKYVSVAVTAALLDGALSVVVMTGVAGDQYKIRDINMEGGGTNFGAGGDRTIVLTDGTTTWTTVPNTSIETLAASGSAWGSTVLPLTTTSDTASASAADIVFKYAGGASDHTTGATRFTVCLEKVS